MQQSFSWSWVQTQVEETAALWQACADRNPASSRVYSRQDQRQREQAYDRALAEVEKDARTEASSATARAELLARTTQSVSRFSAHALDLPPEGIKLLADDLVPVGTNLARWARCFDSGLSKPEIVQACRNAWTACGLQPLFGAQIELTPSILGYSLLYPYTDNYLDQPAIATEQKHHFSERFRQRLRGESIYAGNQLESALWELVSLIEGQYPRSLYAGVYDCLLAIHQAQEDSIKQLIPGQQLSRTGSADLLCLSCAKGGSSVLADACLARGSLTAQESQFAFRWGVLLQLGDDLQDVNEDLCRGSATLFSRDAALGLPLDGLANQLLSFSDCIAAEMADLPFGSRMLKDLLYASWRSLIVNAIAESHRFFTHPYLMETQRSSPFRFKFLQARRKRLSRRRGLYESFFNTFLAEPENFPDSLPQPFRAMTETSCG
jgi:hypothetical protein